MSDAKQYVRADGSGALRVGASRVMLDSVLAAWSQGHSPETIRSQYPSLTLEDVYGALTWSLAHSDQAGEYLKGQSAAWEQWKLVYQSNTSSLRDRLREAKTHAEAE